MDDESKEQLLSLALVCAVNLAVILLIPVLQGRPHPYGRQGHLLPGKGSAHLTSTFSARSAPPRRCGHRWLPPGCR